MKSIKGLVILGVLMVAAVPMFGQSVGSPKSANIAVSANVAKMCFINAGTINLGEYDPFGALPAAASGSFQIQCTKNAANVEVGLTAGLNEAPAGVRNVKHATTTDVIPYALTTAAGDAWTDAVGGRLAVSFPSKALQTITINGAFTTASLDVQDGSYSDTVVAKIYF